ncbi:MAG: lacto-N-biose phosphorylase central domain-containing protein [Christensenellaceae bacterium]
MLKKPLDRIGYGGYLSLAAKFPDFVEEVERIAKEFKEIYRKVKGNNPRSNLKVAVINAWGKLRSWQCFMVAHELWYQKVYSYQGILEALSGMPVDVEFLSFDDVLAGAGGLRRGHKRGRRGYGVFGADVGTIPRWRRRCANGCITAAA